MGETKLNFSQFKIFIKKQDRIIKLLEEIKNELEYSNKVVIEEIPEWTKLPHHLQLTFRTLITLKDATAFDVSKVTGRARALESSYLNQLIMVGKVDKRHKGRKVYFKVTQNENKT